MPLSPSQSQKINGIPSSPRISFPTNGLPIGLGSIGQARKRYVGEEFPKRIAIRPMQPTEKAPRAINGKVGSLAAARPPLPQIKVPKIVSPTPGKLTVKGLSGKNGLLEPAPKVLNPNYRPLENGVKKQQRALEATLTVPVTPSSSSGSISRDSSCISLTISRSPSPCSTRSGVSSRSSIGDTSYSHGLSPRRVFPQTYTGIERSLSEKEFRNLEQSPVVFDANMSFVLGCTKQSVRQSFRPSPAHTDADTASNYLSSRIQDFLKRTDHVMEEWAALGKKSSCDDDTISLIERQREHNRQMNGVGRSRSVTNIMIKGYQILKSDKLPPTSSRSNSLARDFSDTDTIIDDDELSEMTVDLAEERSTANLASERLEAEAAERLKLEKELQEQHGKIRTLQETSEKLEMELICAKSDLNGISEDEDGDNDDGAGGVYKLKYERVARELEFTKRRLQTQHEHDLEQLVGLKKQLEKKLADAYEEVEEQRQVVGQWKRKAQKMTNEMNDLRMLLDEQNSRNNLLEKRQRKFDSECQSLQEGARQEKQAKDRLGREKDILIAEKFTLEQTLGDTRLELELKEEKLASLQRELEEMTFGGGTEEEVAQLKRSKLELERRNKEQEEELDEMAGQVQLLEQAKLRLEMTLETMRKEARREAQQRDDELEEARGASYKKIKALECQLETEHEERTLLVREKHELERRLAAAAEQDRADRAAEESAIQKLKRDLRKYKALLKDAQSQLERAKADSPGKILIRQLRNQIEDAEAARTIAVKARQTAEAELTDLQSLLEETQRAKSDAEEKASQAHRDRSELQAQIEENEEEMGELMKKYTATVKQLNTEQMASSEYEIKISELEAEKNSLKEQIAELTARVENVENMSDPSASLLTKRLELRTKELESKLELEQATKARIEVQCNRHKDGMEKLQQEINLLRAKEMQSQEALKKSQKTLRELREELHTVSNREQESMVKRKDLEKRLETVESECASSKNDLRLALLRIADLQTAMEEGDEDPSDSDQDSDSSDDSLSDLEQRLNPIRPRLTTRIAAKETNGVADDALVIREGRSDNGPRISVALSPSSSTSHGNGDTSYA
ncbi:unconventional myosin-XVIIIa-like isoform X5 [Lutzomyia longipalpis]|uniref:unconventional myosin-XVIIIa-like isoform X5 n=1 Tax=Lutzomyia longipalpis TaxID=7200 RepID=UPI002483E02B|nr:unconventional myosin-XVIIIa-like isoform X5 [Lutzomyia longipalpis]